MCCLFKATCVFSDVLSRLSSFIGNKKETKLQKNAWMNITKDFGAHAFRVHVQGKNRFMLHVKVPQGNKLSVTFPLIVSRGSKNFLDRLLDSQIGL